nr:hypothetical protein [Tanacetum cinerariifolium]
YSIDHQEDLNQQRISDVHDRWDKLNESQNELLKMMQSFCEMVIQQKQSANIDQSPPQEMSIQDMEDLKQQYLDEMKSMINQIQIEDYRNERIDIHYMQLILVLILPSLRDVTILFCYDDDDYEESTIPLNKIISQIPPSIVITFSPPILPIKDFEDSLIMGNKELSTILEKESDEFIKSSVEDLVPIPRESDDTSYSDKECDLPICDNFMTFSNPFFNSNDDFTSSDDKSLSDEDVPDDYVKIYSNPLFEFYADTSLVT